MRIPRQLLLLPAGLALAALWGGCAPAPYHADEVIVYVPVPEPVPYPCPYPVPAPVPAPPRRTPRPLPIGRLPDDPAVATRTRGGPAAPEPASAVPARKPVRDRRARTSGADETAGDGAIATRTR